jgi:hypothetical protein
MYLDRNDHPPTGGFFVSAAGAASVPSRTSGDTAFMAMCDHG